MPPGTTKYWLPSTTAGSPAYSSISFHSSFKEVWVHRKERPSQGDTDRAQDKKSNSQRNHTVTVMVPVEMSFETDGASEVAERSELFMSTFKRLPKEHTDVDGGQMD
ncbi:hypothetical protein CC1G_13598 [Coprinopsis cinerea okayama7|uniref:Uncharacterized protein n=1 Tax=Coprinopsis cinerea (strain Okayama-7 / 130 / ATCC MYA-4618 / FGSC 9003) TaxID=240176 RepID=D6RJU5_COPC7|nr:hypothetical protein CC1G_13598 [Coprinopsis cinerea okayama7\|eukprot:XP_002912065.1 hypothetical protein CC1G_13598 [Coprinopsis cinerea okayama7\